MAVEIEPLYIQRIEQQIWATVIHHSTLKQSPHLSEDSGLSMIRLENNINNLIFILFSHPYPLSKINVCLLLIHSFCKLIKLKFEEIASISTYSLYLWVREPVHWTYIYVYKKSKKREDGSGCYLLKYTVNFYRHTNWSEGDSNP